MNQIEDAMKNMPRQDITSELGKILKKISNKKEWKVRKQGGEDMEQLLIKSGFRI